MHQHIPAPVSFHYPTVGLGGEMSKLVAERHVPVFRTCTDPVWLAQVHDPMDFEELEGAWRDTTAVRIV